MLMAGRLLYHATLGSSVIKKRREECDEVLRAGQGPCTDKTNSEQGHVSPSSEYAIYIERSKTQV